MSENKLNNFRLQFLSHNTVFENREKAIRYINDFFKPEALLSEPAVVYYGDIEEPNMILAVGSGERKVFIIDFAEVSEKITVLEKNNDTESQNIKDAVKTIEGVIKSCGLLFDSNKVENKVSYEPDNKDILIGDAKNIAESIDIISKFVQKESINKSLTVGETKSIKLTYEDNVNSNGKIIKAYTKISTDGDSDEEGFNNNIVGIKSDGIYASAHLEYNEDKNQLIFRTSGKKNGRFQDDAFKQIVNLGKHSEVIANNSEESPVKITINNENSVKKISSNVKLSEDNNNIIKIQDGSLLVDGRANNIKFKNTTVANALNELKDVTKELQDKSVLIETDSDTIDLTIGQNASGNTTIGGEVKRSNDGSLIISEGGLSVKMDLDINAATNTLLLHLGNKPVKEIKLPNIDLTDIVTSIYYDKNQRTLTIKFSNGQTAVIPIADLLTPYVFSSDADSPITLTEISNPENGTSIVKSNIKLRNNDNLVSIDNGELFVSEQNIDNKIKVVNDNLDSINTILNTKIDNTKSELLGNIDEVENELNVEINSIKTVNNEQEEKINTINSNLSEIGVHISSMVENINELESDVALNTSDINVLKTNNEVTKADTAKLKQDVSDNKTAISNEVNRAQAEEKKINDLVLTNQSAITSEIARATTAEQSLNNRVSSNETAISTLNGASTVDGSVRKMISLAITDYVNPTIESESNRAIEKETELKSAIDELSKNVIINNTNTLNEAKAYTDNEIGKVNTIIQSTKTEILTLSANDATDKANKSLSDSKTYTDEKISLEKTRAESKETELDGRISALQTDNATINEKLNKKIESVTIEKNSSTDLQYFLKVDDVVKGEINIPKDQFLKEVTYDEVSKTLRFVFITNEDGEQTTSINISDLIDTYNAGNGLSLNGNIFSVKIAVGSEKYLTVTEDGIMLKGVDAALAEKANSSDVYTKIESDDKFLTEHQDISNLATKEELNTLSENVSSINDRVVESEQSLSVITGNEAQEGSIANTIKIAKTYTDEKVKEESDRAKAAEKVNADAIAILNGNSATDGSINKILNDAKLYTDDKILIERQERTEAIGGLTDMIATKANSSDVYTKAEIDAKGYLTEHQDISNLATKADVENVKINVTTNTSEISNVKTELEGIKFHVADSDTVSTVLKATDTTKELVSNVKISNIDGNIIKFNGNGIYSNVSFNYNRATNIITFNNGNGEQSFELSDHSLVTEGHYDSVTKEIVLTITKENGNEQIRIPVNDLVNEWKVDNGTNNPIKLSKETGTDGIDILKAKLDISTEAHNLILNNNGTLYASNQAKDLTALWSGNEVTIQKAIENLKTETDKLKADVNDVKNNVETLSDKVDTNTSDIATNKGAITNLTSQLTTLLNTVNALDTKVNTYENRITALETTINGNTNPNSIVNRLNSIEEALNKLIDFGVYNE